LSTLAKKKAILHQVTTVTKALRFKLIARKALETHGAQNSKSKAGQIWSAFNSGKFFMTLWPSLV
jgi:hypothetical protein